MTREEMKNLKEMTNELLKLVNSDDLNVKGTLYQIYVEYLSLAGLVLMLDYFNIAKFEDEILQKSIMICPTLDDKLYNAYYKICQDMWLKKANKEIKGIIKELEKEKI